MGRPIINYVSGRGDLFSCSTCRIPLTSADQLVSDQFRCSRGQALLFRTVSNLRNGDQMVKDLSTGRHVIRYSFCVGCHSRLGWTYEYAFAVDQQYKEGSFVLELAGLTRHRPAGRPAAVAGVVAALPGSTSTSRHLPLSAGIHREVDEEVIVRSVAVRRNLTPTLAVLD